jgi:hypothetical protein
MAPSMRVLPSATKGPPSPMPQNPWSSSCMSTMGEKWSYSNATSTSAGVTPAIAYIR